MMTKIADKGSGLLKNANSIHCFRSTEAQLTIKSDERPVLLSINGRGFYVLHYSAIPEQGLTRINFDLVDPNTGEGGSADAIVDPKLLEDLNSYNLGTVKGQAFLIWIDTSSNEVRWQLRKNVKTGTQSFNPP